MKVRESDLDAKKMQLFFNDIVEMENLSGLKIISLTNDSEST